jgi:hypothetical protein
MSAPRKKTPKPPAPKTEFLQIRLSVEDRKRVGKAAGAEYLDASTWARQTILKALYDSETRDRAGRLRVAEPDPD